MNVLFEDPHLLVVNKPAGLPVQPDGWEPDAPYLLKLLEAQFGRLFVVHRLDKVTSGVLVFARDAESHRALSLQFEDHQAQKIYQALVEGAPAWDERITRHPLRVNVGHKHRTVVDDRHGKPSETRFRLLERFAAAARVEAAPRTGRTHQIRVHAAAVGHPLLGDSLYGAEPTSLIGRPALHAYSLTFTHPMSGQPMTLTVQPPEDFAAALKRLGASTPLR